MKLKLFLLFAVFLLVLNVNADTRFFNPNFCAWNGSNFNITAGNKPVIYNNGGNDCSYEINAAIDSIQTNVSTFQPSKNFSCLINMSLYSSGNGRWGGFINGSSGGTYGGDEGLTALALSQSFSCGAPGDIYCMKKQNVPYERADFAFTADRGWYIYNFTTNGSNYSIFTNGHLNASLQLTKDSYTENIYFGQPGDGTGTYINISSMKCYNITKIDAEPPPAGDTTPPTFSNNVRNNTAPRINDMVMFNTTITDATSNVSGYIFSWDNGSGTFINNTFVKLTSGISIANVSINKTITNESGTLIQYMWYANDTLGSMGNSSVYTLTVAGTTPPNITLNLNNFFNLSNNTFYSFNKSQTVLLNLTFSDDIELYGFEFNVTNSLGIIIMNFTNTTLHGTVDNFTRIINVSAPQGYYTASITSWDTHTSQQIPDYKVDKGFGNKLIFDDIKIIAENAIYTDTEKKFDRYNFIFEYFPLITPLHKVFYIESDDELEWRKDSIYKGHFIDWKNKRWVDFEGIEGMLAITKVNDKKWKVEFDDSRTKIKIKSIGGLNSQTQSYTYYIVDPELEWSIPLTNPTSFNGTTFAVSLKVTSDKQNYTTFYLYNSSLDFVSNFTYVTGANGSYYYNHTFTGLADHTYYINATHTDLTNTNKSSTTLTIANIRLTNCSIGYPAVNYTLKDEKNSSILLGDISGTFNYNAGTTIKTYTISYASRTNFSVCIHPAFETLTVDYSILYSSSGYSQRRYEDNNAVFNNATKIISLYLLSSADGKDTIFRTVDAYSNPISNVQINMKKSGGTETIEQEITDDSGLATFFTNPDQEYTFIFTKTGYKLTTYTLRPTSYEIYNIVMESEAEGQAVSYFAGITYFFSPQNQVLVNKTSYTFKFNLTSTYWNLTGCTFKLKNSSNTLASANCHYNSSQSNASILFNTGNQTIIFSEATYQINNTINTTVSYSYKVQWQYKGRFSLRNFLDDITSFTAGGFDDFGRFLLGIFVTLMVVGALSLQSANYREPEILIPAVWLMVAFFSYLGWFKIPLETIPSVIGQNWVVFALVTLTGGAVLIKRNT